MKALKLNGKKCKKDKVFSNLYNDFNKYVSWGNLSVCVEDVSEPIPHSDQVLVKPLFCGICGTDFIACSVSKKDKVSQFRGPLKLPVTLGHEICGVVVDNNNTHLNIDELVSIESIVRCGFCQSCLEGHTNACKNVELIGLTINGGLADYIVAPAINCHSIESLRNAYLNEENLFMAGALIELYGCAYNALFCSNNSYKPGSSLCIHGAGSIGCAIAHLAIISGFSKIILLDKNVNRANWCRSVLPNKEIINIGSYDKVKDIENLIFDITNGDGVDLHIITTTNMGNPPALAINTIGSKGSIVLIVRSEMNNNIYSDNLIDKQANIVGVRGQTGYGIFNKIIALMSNGLLKTEKIITNCIDLIEAKDLLSKGIQGDYSNGKVVVKI